MTAFVESVEEGEGKREQEAGATKREARSAKPVSHFSIIASSVRRSSVYSLMSFASLLLIWAIASAASGGDLPGPVTTIKVLSRLLSNPFYDNGPNDKGIAIQLASSLQRVFVGFTFGSLVAIPIGVLVGASAVFRRIFSPLV